MASWKESSDSSRAAECPDAVEKSKVLASTRSIAAGKKHKPCQINMFLLLVGVKWQGRGGTWKEAGSANEPYFKNTTQPWIFNSSAPWWDAKIKKKYIKKIWIKTQNKTHKKTRDFKGEHFAEGRNWSCQWLTTTNRKQLRLLQGKVTVSTLANSICLNENAIFH